MLNRQLCGAFPASASRSPAAGRPRGEDGHHSVREDCGIALGQALSLCLGDKAGIARFGQAFVPMDESARLPVRSIFPGRPYLVFDAPMPQPMCGQYDTCLTVEFMRALAVNAGLTLHLKSEYGENAHHITEALFNCARPCAQTRP
ncbi:MAG: hypothetical protein ACLR4Z_10335 [Butyricicoccaceae bacterium]